MSTCKATDLHKIDFLVVVAHGDDEVLGMGGTIAALSQQGYRGVTCYFTEGRQSHTSKGHDRIDEMKKAAQILGVSPDFSSLPECDIPLHAMFQAIEQKVNRYQPQLLISTFPQSCAVGHQDHWVIGTAAGNIANRFNLNLLYSHPPVYTTGFTPNVFINITQTLPVKLAAIHAYESEKDKWFMAEDIAKARAIHWAAEGGLYAQGMKYAEPFLSRITLAKANINCFFSTLPSQQNETGTLHANPMSLLPLAG